eukprot:TRINITY_DN183_c0_g1_i12.p1 TRINITY_DN183_c0_g1~~TRINITY_DN183_c0_g1_i12.p1  ORF type:complete len:1529 (-),score=496.41 TRINITY_DN183_c0_g1_i12:489-4835(-)
MGTPLLTKDDIPLSETECISCGQCSKVCPSGAVRENDEDLHELLALMNEYLDGNEGAFERYISGRTADSLRTNSVKPPDDDEIMNAILEETGRAGSGLGADESATKSKTSKPKKKKTTKQGDKIFILQCAPSTRVSLAECFGEESGTISIRRLVGAAKAAGFDYVFDTDWAADLTIIEEACELLTRLEKGGPFPMFTSCCPAWINLVEKRFPHLIPHVSTCRSPMMMMGAVIRTFFCKKMNLDPANVVSVAMMPCTAKKDEIHRERMFFNGKKTVDYVLTTREFARFLGARHVDLNQVERFPFDDPLGETTGAAALFGVTGGVMEAAIRTVHEWVTGEPYPLEQMPYQVSLRGLSSLKEAEIKLGDNIVRVAVVSGGKNVQELLRRIGKKGSTKYHFIEVMACPSGCINGGGQPISLQHDVVVRRMQALYAIDSHSKIRLCHENESLKQFYREAYGITELAHPTKHRGIERPEELHILHTSYARKFHGVIDEVGTTATGSISGESMKNSEPTGKAGDILVLYGSQGGRTATKAQEFARAGQRLHFPIRHVPMNAYDAKNIETERFVLVLTSTFGEGNLPDNAQTFYNFLCHADPGFCDNIEFAVCGFGSTDYPKFCEAAKLFDAAFEKLGGTRILDLVECDENSVDRGESTFESWASQIWALMGSTGDSIHEPSHPKYMVSLALASPKAAVLRCPPRFKFVKMMQSASIMRTSSYVVGNGRIGGSLSSSHAVNGLLEGTVRLLTLDLEGTGVNYEVGHVASILPRNPSDVVEKFFERHSLDPSTHISITSLEKGTHSGDIPPLLTVGELFYQYIDLCGPPTKKFLRDLPFYAIEDDDKNKLLSLLENDDDVLSEYLSERTYYEVFEDFPSVILPMSILISIIPLIQPRVYAVASSPKQNPSQLDLVVRHERYTTPSGRVRDGLCSLYLTGLSVEKSPLIPIRTNRCSQSFPKYPASPLIMLAIGPGVAFYRGFMQEREALLRNGEKIGPAILIYEPLVGTMDANSKDEIHMLQFEFQKYRRLAVLSEFHVLCGIGDDGSGISKWLSCDELDGIHEQSIVSLKKKQKTVEKKEGKAEKQQQKEAKKRNMRVMFTDDEFGGSDEAAMTESFDDEVRVEEKEPDENIPVVDDPVKELTRIPEFVSAESARFIRYLKHTSCNIYYSGPAYGIPQRVLEELRNGFMEHSGLTESKATAWWERMEREQRVHIESYSSRGGTGGSVGTEVSYVSSLIVEKNKTDALLYQLLPKVYADRIKQGAKRIADHHECVSVLFADICGFTQMSSSVTADTVVDMLDELFHEFDVLTEKMEIVKVKNIGDAIMCCCGLFDEKDHALRLLRYGMGLIQIIEKYSAEHGHPIDVRVGINSGPVVAGVVGKKTPLLDLFGDAVNVASRMESNGVPHHVQVSESTHELLSKEGFDFEKRSVVAKGKGEIPAFVLKIDREKRDKLLM